MKKEHEVLAASCAICQSPLRTEIENKDTACKVDQTIIWARKQGVNISRFTLAKHRANHLAPKAAPPPSEPPPATTNDKANPKATEPADGTTAQRIAQQTVEAPTESATEKAGSKAENITDLIFLDTVRDMVYQKLIEGGIELKVDSAFKAIEIKHKIAEESQNEKLLLEILNELRVEELKGARSS